MTCIVITFLITKIAFEVKAQVHFFHVSLEITIGPFYDLVIKETNGALHGYHNS